VRRTYEVRVSLRRCKVASRDDEKIGEKLEDGRRDLGVRKQQ